MILDSIVRGYDNCRGDLFYHLPKLLLYPKSERKQQYSSLSMFSRPKVASQQSTFILVNVRTTTHKMTEFSGKRFRAQYVFTIIVRRNEMARAWWEKRWKRRESNRETNDNGKKNTLYTLEWRDGVVHGDVISKARDSRVININYNTP